jgi:hypothetical protein
MLYSINTAGYKKITQNQFYFLKGKFYPPLLDIRQQGWVGLCVGIFSSLQG